MTQDQDGVTPVSIDRAAAAMQIAQTEIFVLDRIMCAVTKRTNELVGLVATGEVTSKDAATTFESYAEWVQCCRQALADAEEAFWRAHNMWSPSSTN
jgi:hypothetical protein